MLEEGENWRRYILSKTYPQGIKMVVNISSTQHSKPASPDTLAAICIVYLVEEISKVEPKFWYTNVHCG